jgi:hypothetical protein
MTVYVDADHVNDLVIRKSITGVLVTLYEKPISIGMDHQYSVVEYFVL